MPPPSPSDNSPQAQGRFTQWVSQNQPIARLVSLTLGLGIFLVFLPSYMRDFLWNGLQSHKFLSAMLLLFTLLAISLVWSAGQKLDARGFLFFNVRGARPLWLDRVMLGLTQLGSGVAVLGMVLVLYLTGNRFLSYQLILGTLTLWIVVELLKFLVQRSRPFIRLAEMRTVGFRPRGRSFPSGHTSQSFFLATLMVQHLQAGMGVAILVYSLALLVGITRMYVGAHYPRDVLAGAILGSAWGLMVAIVSGYVVSGIG